MSANATIDITSMTAPTQEVKTNNSNVNSPSNFEHIFNDANDKYSKKDSSSHSNKTSNNSVSNSNQNKNNRVNEANDDKKQSVSQNTQSTNDKQAANASCTDDKKVLDNQADNAQKTDNTDKADVPEESANQNAQDLNNQAQANDNVVLANLAQAATESLPQDNVKSNPAPASTTSANESTKDDLDTIASQINDGTIQFLAQPTLPSFLSNQNVAAPVQAPNQGQVQQQPQVKVLDSIQNQNQAQAQAQNAAQVQNQPQAQLSDLQQANNAPVVQTNTEALASNVNLENTADTKQNVQNVPGKTPLTQEVLDATNAKVVSVETQGSSNSNLGNLLNNQSAQEQTVKLAIANNSVPAQSNQDVKPAVTLPNPPAQTQDANLVKGSTQQIHQNTEMPAFADALNQANNANQLENVQGQAPKELSKTDILTQINSQLNKFQPEEGTTKVTIVLKPENLGKINIELMNGKGGLTAQMTTDSPQVKEILDKHLDSLKSTLGDNGVNVNNVNVKVHETTKQDNSNMFSFDENGHKQQQQPNNKQELQNQNNAASSSGNESDTADDVLTDIAQSSDETLTSQLSENTGEIDYRV